MLGRLLELSLVVDDVGIAWQRWQALGFVAASAGDVWPHPYGVVACRGLAIGLHARGDEPVALTFVREDVAQLERELSLRLLGVDHAQLGAEAFNFVELREPGGMLLRIVEARTFSPPAAAPADTTLGRFVCISLPSADIAEARSFLERLDTRSGMSRNPGRHRGYGTTGALHDAANCAVRRWYLPAKAKCRGPARRRIAVAQPLPELDARAHRVLKFREGSLWFSSPVLDEGIAYNAGFLLPVVRPEHADNGKPGQRATSGRHCWCCCWSPHCPRRQRR